MWLAPSGAARPPSASIFLKLAGAFARNWRRPMSDLRERFRALDALDVPDVLARARMIGPKPPEPDPTPPFRRAGALVFAAVVAILAVFLITRALDEETRPADPPTPTPTPTDTAFRSDGEVVTYSNDDAYAEGDVVAVDPDTGEMRTLVANEAL